MRVFNSDFVKFASGFLNQNINYKQAISINNFEVPDSNFSNDNDHRSKVFD